MSVTHIFHNARMMGGNHTVGIFNTTTARDRVTDTKQMLSSCKKDLQKNKQKIETSNETTQQHSQKDETRRWRGWSLESGPRKIEHTRYSKNFVDKSPFSYHDFFTFLKIQLQPYVKSIWQRLFKWTLRKRMKKKKN